MKKILTSMLILIMCFSLTACGDKKESDSKDDTKTQTTDKVTLSNLQSKIESLGIKCEKSVVAYDMVGAKDGFKLKSNSKTIEVYQFDKNSSEYKEAESSQKLNLSSMNMKLDATIKNGYAYIIDKDFEKYDDVIKILNKLN